MAFDCDPVTHADAVRYDTVTLNILAKELKVMDGGG